jgi:hypothetical protein
VEKYGTAGQATDGNIIWRMNIACWMPKATNTHSEHVILIAFPQQQWLCKGFKGGGGVCYFVQELCVCLPVASSPRMLAVRLSVCVNTIIERTGSSNR